MRRIKRFFQTAGIYLLGNVFTKLVSFLLLPLYTNRIEPASFGSYSLVVSILNVVVPISFFSIWDSVFRFSFDYDNNEKYTVFSIGSVIMLLGSIILVIVICCLRFFYSFEFPILVCIYGLMTGYQYFYTVIARALKDNVLFVFSGCVNSLLTMTLNIVLIVCFNMGVESFYISFIVGVFVQVLIIESRKHFITYFKLDKEAIVKAKEYLSFSFPVTVSAISNWLLNGLTQILIAYWLGNYYNGLYGVANKFSSVMVLSIGVLQFAWNEMAYDLSNDKNRKTYYSKSISVILKYSIMGVSLLIILVKIVYPILIATQYNESLEVIPFLLIGTIANCFASFLGTLYLAEKKTTGLFATTLIAGGVNLILSLIMIPNLKFVGACVALCLAYVFFAIMRVISLKKQMNVVPDVESIKPIFLLLISVISFFCIESVIGLLGIFLVLLIATMFYSKSMLHNLVILKKKKCRLE